MAKTFSAEEISAIGRLLNDTNRPIGQRFRSLFTLRNIGGTDSIDQICKCLLSDDSALLKHECAYCLGQIQDTYAIPVLNQVLANTEEHPMVRHEAGEALGAIGDRQSIDILKVWPLNLLGMTRCALRKFTNDSNKAVSETCILALKRIECLVDGIKDSGDSYFSSVDPVPHYKSDDIEIDVSKLESLLTDPNNDLFSRYRAMFALRNINTNESAVALAKGLKCSDSALFRHEVAYVLGQMQNPSTVDQLAEALKNMNENEMVRHECAEALGSIASSDAERELNKYIEDPQRVVRESVEVALDISDYNNSKEFQFIECTEKS